MRCVGPSAKSRGICGGGGLPPLPPPLPNGDCVGVALMAGLGRITDLRGGFDEGVDPAAKSLAPGS